MALQATNKKRTEKPKTPGKGCSTGFRLRNSPLTSDFQKVEPPKALGNSKRAIIKLIKHSKTKHCNTLTILSHTPIEHDEPLLSPKQRVLKRNRRVSLHRNKHQGLTIPKRYLRGFDSPTKSTKQLVKHPLKPWKTL